MNEKDHYHYPKRKVNPKYPCNAPKNKLIGLKYRGIRKKTKGHNMVGVLVRCYFTENVSEGRLPCGCPSGAVPGITYKNRAYILRGEDGKERSYQNIRPIKESKNWKALPNSTDHRELKTGSIVEVYDWRSETMFPVVLQEDPYYDCDCESWVIQYWYDPAMGPGYANWCVLSSGDTICGWEDGEM